MVHCSCSWHAKCNNLPEVPWAQGSPPPLPQALRPPSPKSPAPAPPQSGALAWALHPGLQRSPTETLGTGGGLAAKATHTHTEKVISHSPLIAFHSLAWPSHCPSSSSSPSPSQPPKDKDTELWPPWAQLISLKTFVKCNLGGDRRTATAQPHGEGGFLMLPRALGLGLA